MTLFLEKSYSSVVHYTTWCQILPFLQDKYSMITEQAYEIPVSQKIKPKNQDLWGGVFLGLKGGLRNEGERVLGIRGSGSQLLVSEILGGGLQSCFLRVGGGLRPWFLLFEAPCEIQQTKHYSRNIVSS